MKATSRRSFVKNSALAAGTVAAVQMLPDGWYGIAHAGETGYFTTEFGITDQLCHRQKYFGKLQLNLASCFLLTAATAILFSIWVYFYRLM